MTGWLRIAVLALATVCLAAEDVEEPPRTPSTDKPVAESDDGKASPPVADRESVAQPAQREPSAPTPASESTLRRIRTMPLSAAADIPLPQDI